MNTTEELTLTENSPVEEPRLELLRWIYLNAGLRPNNALEAAIADYTHLFSDAA